MPLPLIPIAVVGLGALGVGAGVKMAGDGVEDTSEGISKLLLALAAVGAVYLVAKKMKVI